MWKAAAGAQITVDKQNADDDWETDPDFINDVTEQEQRWGSTTVEGSGRTAGAIDMEKLRRETEEADSLKKKKQLIEGANSAFGYGGKFGVQKDRMDQCAVGHDYVGKVEKHVSQKDYSTGFGGKFGVQTDRVDKSAVTWDHKEKVEKHASQKDYVTGFGGKFGVQKDRQDKSAVGWDHIEKVEKHESQKDYSVGFGGKFGVQKDRQDKSAVGWDHHEAPQKHESQTDHKVGFGGKFGIQTDRMDKSAVTFSEQPSKIGTAYTKVKPDIGSAKPFDLKSKFENINAQQNPTEPLSSPAPGKNIHVKAAIFDKKDDQPVSPASGHVRKQLDPSKTAFLTQPNVQETDTNNKILELLSQDKLEQYLDRNNEISNVNQGINLVDQQEELPKKTDDYGEAQAKVYDMQYNNQEATAEESIGKIQEPEFTAEEIQDVIQEDEIVDTGLSAVALYDYQAGADDEISFDPEDIITHVETIHEGWWRGMCKGKHGLFPANYVQLQQ